MPSRRLAGIPRASSSCLDKLGAMGPRNPPMVGSYMMREGSSGGEGKTEGSRQNKKEKEKTIKGGVPLVQGQIPWGSHTGARINTRVRK